MHTVGLGVLRPALLFASLLALAGCGGSVASGPVQWWHQLEGGRIAQDRPAPPNAEAPYPNLASVPARPAATPAEVRTKIAEGLVADRANAAYGASQIPVMPARPVIVQHPPQLVDASSATMAAAEPPRAAPRGKVASSPLAAPLASAPEMPVMPAAPPTPPSLPGVAQTTAASPPPVAPPVVAAPAAEPVPGVPVALTFAPGAAALPSNAAKALQSLAAQRGSRSIVVTGFGDATGVDAASQEAALALALARARAIAIALAQAGVPEAAIRQDAQALGAGGIARIQD